MGSDSIDFSNDETEYQALMVNGVTEAKQFKLAPGVALSAAQVAQLTSDIVWLVEQTVTLADGSTIQALVPQVYVRVQAGDLNNNGALISADSVNLHVAGDLNNSGSIAGRTVLALNANNVNNLGGRITANDVSVTASHDLNNLGGQIDATNSLIATYCFVSQHCDCQIAQIESSLAQRNGDQKTYRC